MINVTPRKKMHDNGKQFMFIIFRHFLVTTREMIDKQILNSYAQIQVEIEACIKKVKNEFLAIEDSPTMVDGKLRCDMSVKAYWIDIVESGGGKFF